MKSRIVRSIGLVMLLIVMVILPVMATGCGQTTTTAKTLKVGFMTPATSAVSEKGLAGKNGIIDAVRYINEELGGVDGSGAIRLKAIYRDSQYKQDISISIINDFMEQRCLMFMTHSSTEMSYVQTIANEAGFPGLVCYASPLNYQPPAHIYAQTPDYGDDAANFAKYYMQHIWNQTGTETGKPKVVVLGLANPTGWGARDGVVAVADELGLEVLPFEQHSLYTLDETGTLTRVNNEHPNLILISSTPRPAALIMQNLHQLGMYPKAGLTVAMTHAAFTEEVVALAGDPSIVEGVYGAFPTAIWGDDFESVNKAKEYAAEYNPQNIGSADYLSTWTAVMIIREILKSALDKVDYDVLAKGDAEAWQAIEEYGIQKLDHYDVEGLQYEATYVQGDNRLDRWLKICRITDGNIISITDWIEASLIEYE